MSADDIVALVLAVMVAGDLVLALLAPGRWPSARPSSAGRPHR
jgi:hypothetical protein